jgi:hypothetical protein
MRTSCKHPFCKIEHGNDRTDDGAQWYTDPMVDGTHGVDANAHKSVGFFLKMRNMLIFA